MITALIIAGSIAVYLLGAAFTAYLTGRRRVDSSSAFFLILTWPISLPIGIFACLYELGEDHS